jgi:hypothetical protein
MLAWLRFKRELRRFERQKKRLLASPGKPEALDEYFEHIGRVDDEIAESVSYYLIQRAQGLHLATPSDSNDTAWVRSHRTGLKRLSDSALSALQTTIRNEKKARLQLWEIRVKIVAPTLTASVGLAGALIGLVAVFKR